MHLPEYINEYIEKEVSSVKTSDLLKARERLTGNYRNSGLKSATITTREDVLSYVVSRLPVIYPVLKSVMEQIPGEIKNMLDIGSGPGTATYAAVETFRPEKVTIVERNRDLLQAAKTICKNSGIPVLEKVKVILQDISALELAEQYDLITISYVLNELSEESFEKLIKEAWAKTDKYLLLAEPGTPEGFGNIRKARDMIIKNGGNILLPCPHEQECPVAADDWCHFSKRVDRSRLLRQIKQGTESYEDEKFSYVLFSKNKTEKTSARIVRHPFYHKGFVELQLCTAEGLKKITVSKKENERYKKARKADWGDSFE